MSTTDDKIQIVKPTDYIFESPIVSISEKMIFSGVATSDVTFYINNKPQTISVQDQIWSYEWETKDLTPGNYYIVAECGNAKDQLEIKLIDETVPSIEIDYPADGEIIEADEILIYGKSSDNQAVSLVELSLDGSEYRLANGTESWEINWDITNFSLGVHEISAKAVDSSGCVSYNNISIFLNESGQSWTPIINSLYQTPSNPNNTSNVVVYADVTFDSPFPIEDIMLYWNDSIKTGSGSMFRYADNPVQARHEEDPLRDEPNDPIYGFELGQFSSGKTIVYWIKATDAAGNIEISEPRNFVVT